jgi:phage tail sheath gpL-like
MALTSIGTQRTPGRPIEITFEAEQGLPSDLQELLLIGHAASGATGINTVVTVNNVSSLSAASGEVATKFGDGSEIAKMVLAAVRANEGGSTFPKIKCVPLASTETAFGPSDAALTAAKAVKAEYIVSPYSLTNSTLRTKIIDAASVMSGAQRVENNQFGTFAVAADQATVDPSLLPQPDTQFFVGIWKRDSAPVYSNGELAAAAAAVLAANGVPFNPVDGLTIKGVAAPTQISEYITVGAGLESETALLRGITPLQVKPNGDVAFVRSVTSRRTVDADGVTEVNAYYDVQDFNVLYFWRKTLFTRFNQPDFKRRKASDEAARELRSEVIRLAQAFEDQGMFQKVSDLAKDFVVERNASDRHRFDVLTPVNVVPGLHVIATNVAASTRFDVVTI